MSVVWVLTGQNSRTISIFARSVNSRGLIFSRVSESIEEIGVCVFDIMISVVESAVESVVESDEESVILIFRSFADQTFPERRRRRC
jgi:hypothetical protein